MNMNIFENAKFGDKYTLKNGRKAIFSRFIYNKGTEYQAILVSDYCEKIVYVYLDGRSCSTDPNESVECVTDVMPEDDVIKRAYEEYDKSVCLCAEDGFIKGFVKGLNASKQ